MSVLDGFHACIFAYGQTGSGKTHTMQGTAGDAGVYSHSLQTLFDECAARRDSHAFAVSVSMVEIYNETVRDLLVAPSGGASASVGASASSSSSSSGEVNPRNLELKQGAHGVYVAGVQEHDVASAERVAELMRLGETNRSVGATDANAHSSRSHMLLLVDVVGTSAVTGAVSRGRLVLVDLAGSERVSKSGVSGERMKEAQNINKSLSALGDVITALTHKTPHVPYRNSKLTYLLQDSLGKDNKTLMIVQVAPSSASRSETLCSLNFAARVRKVEQGRARVHGDTAELQAARQAAKEAREEARSAAAQARAAADSEAKLKKSLKQAKAEADDLQAKLAAAEAASRRAAAGATASSSAAQQITALSRDLSEAKTLLATARRDAEKATAHVEDLKAQVARLDAAARRQRRSATAGAAEETVTVAAMRAAIDEAVRTARAEERALLLASSSSSAQDRRARKRSAHTPTPKSPVSPAAKFPRSDDDDEEDEDKGEGEEEDEKEDEEEEGGGRRADLNDTFDLARLHELEQVRAEAGSGAAGAGAEEGVGGVVAVLDEAEFRPAEEIFASTVAEGPASPPGASAAPAPEVACTPVAEETPGVPGSAVSAAASERSVHASFVQTLTQATPDVLATAPSYVTRHELGLSPDVAPILKKRSARGAARGRAVAIAATEREGDDENENDGDQRLVAHMRSRAASADEARTAHGGNGDDDDDEERDDQAEHGGHGPLMRERAGSTPVRAPASRLRQTHPPTPGAPAAPEAVKTASSMLLGAILKRTSAANRAPLATAKAASGAGPKVAKARALGAPARAGVAAPPAPRPARVPVPPPAPPLDAAATAATTAAALGSKKRWR